LIKSEAARNKLERGNQALQEARAALQATNEQLEQEIAERVRMGEALQKAHDDLDVRVRERTAKLAEANEKLCAGIAERVQAEQALQTAHNELVTKAAQLEEANAELSQYAYVVSHDLKTPLRAIHNYADFLGEDLEYTLDEEQKEYLDGLRRAVRQGEELIANLLELSRIERRSEDTESINMGVFLQKLTESLNLSSDVEVMIGNGLPMIDAEPTLLRQIFQNLIGNAIKFNNSPHKRVEMGWLPARENQCELFVRDNGIGIEPRYQERIFRVFQRLHLSEEYDGAGIGLAIVRKAISKLHASVRVESKPGEGSTFFVALPKTQEES